MNTGLRHILWLGLLFAIVCHGSAQEEGLANNRYLWEQEGGTDTVRTRIPTPPGYSFKGDPSELGGMASLPSGEKRDRGALLQ